MAIRRPRPGRLTEQQVAVLALAAAGLSDKEVAQRAQISERTVRFHFANIRARLGAASRTQAVAMAVSRRLVSVRARRGGG
jgi:DNA-binding NarL/FixJ family response regulator